MGVTLDEFIKIVRVETGVGRWEPISDELDNSPKPIHREYNPPVEEYLVGNYSSAKNIKGDRKEII